MWGWRKRNISNFIRRSTFTGNPNQSILMPKGAPRNAAPRERWIGNVMQTCRCSRGLNPVHFSWPKISSPHLSARLIQESIFMTVEFPKTFSSKTWCYLEIDSKLSKSIRYWTNSAFVILALILVTAELNLNSPQRVLHWWQFGTSRLYFKCLY